MLDASADMAETTPDTINSTFDSYQEVYQVATGGYETSNTNSITKFSNDFSDFIENTFNDWTYKQCTQWQPTHHIYFQVANALFLIAFLSPHKPYYGYLCARCAFAFGSIFMAMWGYLIECTIDAVIWSALFLIVNLVYLIVLIYQLRPIRFDSEIEAVIIIFIFL